MTFHQLVRHPGLPSTPKYAHRNGSMVQIVFGQIYGTRTKWPRKNDLDLIIVWLPGMLLLELWNSDLFRVKNICFSKSNTSVSLYIYVFLAGVVLFVRSRHECSTLPPDVGAFGSHTPMFDYVFGTSRMEMLLWTVLSFLRFRCTVGFDVVFTSRIQVFRENTHFHV